MHRCVQQPSESLIHCIKQYLSAALASEMKAFHWLQISVHPWVQDMTKDDELPSSINFLSLTRKWQKNSTKITRKCLKNNFLLIIGTDPGDTCLSLQAQPSVTPERQHKIYKTYIVNRWNNLRKPFVTLVCVIFVLTVFSIHSATKYLHYKTPVMKKTFTTLSLQYTAWSGGCV